MTRRHPDAASPQLDLSDAPGPAAPEPALPVAWPERAAWGTVSPLRAWQQAAMTLYFAEPRRDFLAVATPGAGKTTFALTVAAELLGRRQVDRVIVVAPTEHLKVQWARGGRHGGHPAGPGVLRGQGQDLRRLRRHRRHLRRCRGQPAGDADPHRAFQDPGDPRRGAPRRRRDVVGGGRPRGVRAGVPAARAHRDAVPLRRQPDPVRDLRARARPGAGGAGLRPRLHLRLRARAGRPRGPAGSVHGLLRRHAVAHPRRRRGRSTAGRAVDQGPVRAGAAHRARSRAAPGWEPCSRPPTGASRRYAGTCPTPEGW